MRDRQKSLFLRVAVVLVTGGILGGCVVEPPLYEATYVTVPPPPPRVEIVGLAPTPGYFWIDGYWRWVGARYEWVPGRWEAPRPGYRYVPHEWVQERGGWRQEPGRWEPERHLER